MKTQTLNGATVRADNRRREQEGVPYRIRQRRRTSFAYSAGLVIAYFAFVLIVTLGKRALNGQLVSGLSLAMLLGIAIILACLASTTIYIAWLGRLQKTHDRAVSRGAAHESR